MTRLLRVELRRLFTRRAPWLALVAAVLVALAALWGVHQQANQIDRARSGADTALQQEQERWEQEGEQWVADCEREQDSERRRTGDGTIDFGCDQMGPPTAEDFYGSMPSLVDQYDELLGYLVYPLLLLPLALGSTHVAAEFSHRTMGAWLTFVPRRGPVYASKLGSAALAAVPVVGLGLALVLVGVPALFRWHGIDDGVSGTQWGDLLWKAVRMILLGAAAGAFGAAAGFLLRHSGAVIGLMLGYLTIVEGIVGSMLPSLSRYLLGNNIDAVVDDGTEWRTYVDCTATGPCREVVHTLDLGQGVLLLALVLGVLAALALWRFHRSDVD